MLVLILVVELLAGLRQEPLLLAPVVKLFMLEYVEHFVLTRQSYAVLALRLFKVKLLDAVVPTVNQELLVPGLY